MVEKCSQAVPGPKNPTWLGLALVALLAVPVSGQEMLTAPAQLVSYPSLILHNGKIATMEDRTTSTNPGRFVQAMAIRDESIFALGSNDQMLALAGPETWRVDLKGRTVIPGIIDAHTHIHNHALSYWLSKNPHVVEQVAKTYSVDAETYEDLKHRIEVVLRERVQNSEEGQWAFIKLPTTGSGQGIGTTFLQDRQMTSKELDEMAPKNPVLIEAHPSRVMNSAAQDSIAELYRTELTDEVDESGFINDTAWYGRALVVDGYFNDKTDQLAEIVRDGMLKQAAVGITSFSSHIMGFEFFDALQRMNQKKELPIRFAYTHYSGFQANPDPAAFYIRMGDMAGFGSDYFWNAAVGLGSVDSGPPRMCTSMEANPDVKDREWCKNAPGTATSEAIYEAIKAGQRVALGHAYADKAVDYFMDDIERAMRDKGDITLDYVRSRRFSSDHCGFYPRKDQIPRIANLGMIISCRANYINRSYPWLEIYGMEYSNRVAPIKSMLDGGVRVVMEAEIRVESGSGPTYFSDFLPYITRRTYRGQDVAPEEAIDRVQVMKMATTWASEYILKEDKLGTLEAGKLADFLVLNKDFFTAPEEDIHMIFPLMTVVGGDVIVLRKELADELGKDAVGPQIEFRPRRSRRN